MVAMEVMGRTVVAK